MPNATPTLKIAHVVHCLDVGGLERNVINQARLAHVFGQEITIICLERDGELANEARKHGARVISLGKKAGIRPGVIATIHKILRKHSIDIVHSHQIGALLYAGIAAALARTRATVHTEHGHKDYGGRLRTRLLGHAAGCFADIFYCLTTDIASAISSHRIIPRRKLRIIQNGIDLIRYTKAEDVASVRSALGIPVDAPVMGTVGRLSPVKRPDMLVHAFAAVRQRVPDAHLLLVGDGPMRASLARLASALGIETHVHFAGYQLDTARYHQALSVFVTTSKSEGMPQAVLEAYASGIPVVAPRLGGLSELIEDGTTGALFDPDDQRGAVEAVTRLLTDRDEAKRLGEAGRRRVLAKFDILRMAGEYNDAYLSLVARLAMWPPTCCARTPTEARSR